jgi:hypothetical protein
MWLDWVGQVVEKWENPDWSGWMIERMIYQGRMWRDRHKGQIMEMNRNLLCRTEDLRCKWEGLFWCSIWVFRNNNVRVTLNYFFPLTTLTLLANNHCCHGAPLKNAFSEDLMGNYGVFTVQGRPHLIGRYSYLEGHSFGDHLRSEAVRDAIECDRSLYCALFCVFMTRVCPISLLSEHPILMHPQVNKISLKR